MISIPVYFRPIHEDPASIIILNTGPCISELSEGAPLPDEINLSETSSLENIFTDIISSISNTFAVADLHLRKIYLRIAGSSIASYRPSDGDSPAECTGSPAAILAARVGETRWMIDARYID